MNVIRQQSRFHVGVGAGAEFERMRTRVLNPELFTRLWDWRGSVKIASEGEPMSGDVLPDANGRPYLHITEFGETYRVNCPYCGDTKHRLWVPHRYGTNYAEEQPDGRVIGRELRSLGICFNDEKCLDDPAKREQLRDQLLGFRNFNARFLMAPDAVRQVHRDLESCAKLCNDGDYLGPFVTHGSPEAAYLEARGFDHEIWRRYGLRSCPSVLDAEHHRLMVGRIVAPIVFENLTVGWQGRLIGEPRYRGEPKYFTMPGLPKRRILYNYNAARHQPFIVVCEGVTSVWRYGDCAVALLGKTLSVRQKELLMLNGVKPIVFSLDADALEESRGMIKSMTDAGWPCCNIPWPPGRDAADCEREEAMQIMYAAAASVGLTLPRVP